MVFIYILKLEKDKYYIGKTNNPEFRLDMHFNSNGSAWTTKYKPIKLLELIKDCDDYDEDKYTRIYMDKYGIENVRGGSFTSVKLDNKTIKYLNHLSNGANDRCFKCGGIGHFIKDCDENSDNSSSSDDDTSSSDDDDTSSSDSDREDNNSILDLVINIASSILYDNSDKIKCFRCGRKGHYASSCYASKHINGYYLK